MPNIFINKSQRRLRAFWRLALYFITIFVFLTIPSTLFVLLAQLPYFQNLVGDASFISSGLFMTLNAALTFAAILGASFFCARVIDRRTIRNLGFHFSRQWWRDFGFGLGLGIVLMALIFVIEYLLGWIEITGTLFTKSTSLSYGAGILQSLILFVYVGIYEEVMSRGYLMRNLAEGFAHPKISPRIALAAAYLLSSAVFSVFHLGNPNTSGLSTLNLFFAGLFLGFGYLLTGELAIPIGLHITWNFFQGNVFGFPVSGSKTIASFLEIKQLGTDWITGGAFGPEAGLVGLLAIAFGMVITAFWVKRVHGELKAYTQLAVYQPEEKTVEFPDTTEVPVSLD
jgi:membrane protease YdiL (CAAX protease family)